MKVIVTKETVVIAEYSCINEGEVCVNTCYFDFPECFEGLSVTAAFNNIPVPVTDNQCNIPSLKKGTVTLGVYAYTEDENGVTLMYSPKPTVFYVNQGSYSEEISVEEIPTVTEFEQYCRSFSAEMQNLLVDTEKISNKVTEITEESTDEQYPSAKAVYDLQTTQTQKTVAAFNEQFENIFDKSQSTNLLDISTMKVGLLNNSDGKVYTGGSYDVYRYFEQYIPVSTNDVISYQWTYNGKRYWTVTDNGANATIIRITAYDKDKNILGSLGAVSTSSNKLVSYTVPETVAFIRVTLGASAETLYSDIAIVKNATDIIPYEEYGVSTTSVLKEKYHNDEHIKKIATEAIEEAPLYNPLAFLPDEICCAVGRTIEIYNSQVCPLADKYHIKWDCSIGKALKRKFSVTGTEALVGEYPLSMCIYDDEFNVLYEKSVTLKIVQGLSSALSVCTIGDSLTNGKYWLNEVRSLSSNNINFVGTRGTTEGLKHEGRSGFTSNAYLKAISYTFENEGVHPFWDSTNSKFSWAYYKTNSGINPDAVQIFLGTNDLASSMTVETFSSNIKKMVDSIREADTAIPIYIVLTICWGNQNGIGIQTSSDGFASQKGRFKYETDCKTIDGVQTLYNTLKEYTNLYFVPLTQCHDSEYNFGNVETPVNPRATQKELMPTEAVHPQKQGYEQMADVMYSVMSAHG